MLTALVLFEVLLQQQTSQRCSIPGVSRNQSLKHVRCSFSFPLLIAVLSGVCSFRLGCRGESGSSRGRCRVGASLTIKIASPPDSLCLLFQPIEGTHIANTTPFPIEMLTGVA